MSNKLNIRKEISKYSFKDNPFIDDAIIKGGYRVVRTIKERNAIDCCHRKLGMKVMVIGQNYSYKDYILKGEHVCSNDNWVLDENNSGVSIDNVNDSDITLLDDYSDLDITQDIETQQDLNKVLARILKTILNNQTVRDKNYIHDQFLPSVRWEFNHSLNKVCAITIRDTAGSEVEGKVLVNNGTKVIIEFNFPFSGTATLN